MKQSQKIILFLSRVTLGWLFFYAGLAKILKPGWSAEGYLKGAKTFAGFYQWLATPAFLPIVNFLNEWGLTLVGLAFILGVGLRVASIAGAGIMFLYYLPILEFPYPNPHSFLVDEHIVYGLSLLVLYVVGAGDVLGLGRWCGEKFPGFKKIFG